MIDREVIGRKDDSVGKAVRKGWEGGRMWQQKAPWQTGGHTRQEGLKRGTRCKLNPADESVNKDTQQSSKWQRVMRELGEEELETQSEGGGRRKNLQPCERKY